MRSVPLDDLSLKQRETYTLLWRLESLPFELQERVVSFLATDYDHLRILKRLGRATWEAVRPVLHRILRLTRSYRTRDDVNDLLEVFPTLVKYCRYPHLDLNELPHSNAIRWSEELPRRIAEMSRLQTMCIVRAGGPNEHLVVAATQDLPEYGGAEVVAFSPRDNTSRRSAQAFFRRLEWQASSGGAASSRPAKVLGFHHTLAADVEVYSAAVAVERLRLYCLRGQVGTVEAAFSRLTHLAIQDCRDLILSSIMDMLQSCSESIQYLGICSPAPWAEASWTDLGDPLHLPQLRSLSFEIIGRFRFSIASFSVTSQHFHRHLIAPRLERLGLGNLCDDTDAACIKAIIDFRRRTAQPAIYTRSISYVQYARLYRLRQTVPAQ